MNRTQKRLIRGLAVLCVFAASSASLRAQVFFADDFEGFLGPNVVTNSGTINGYTILFTATSGPEDFTAIFSFDYSTVTYPTRIPSAPHSRNGSTHGLFLTVNKDGNAAAAAVNLYPFGVAFADSYSLLFDVWLNYGTGNTTEHALFGINHSGSVTNQIGKQGSDGIYVGIDGDGGVSATSGTIRDYPFLAGRGTNTPLLLLTNNTVFGPGPLLGNRFDNADAGFTNLFPSRAIAGFGNTPNGSAGLAWISGEVRQQTNVITWLLNGRIVAQYTNSITNDFFYSNGDIMLGYSDFFASIGDSNVFAVIDNVRVVDPSSIKTWSGTVNSNWFNATNWIPVGVPGSNDIINISSGNVNLTAPVTIHGDLNWYGGAISGSALTIAGDGTMTINGSSAKTLQGTLTNAGTVTWAGSGNLIVANGTCNGTAGRIENLFGALWNIEGDGQMFNSSTCLVMNAYFRNNGTVRKSGGTGTTYISIPFTNNGTLIPASGYLAIVGDLMLPPSSILQFPVCGTNIAVQFGQLQVSGGLRFGGVLAMNTSFTPVFPEAFRVITCGSHTGGFVSHNLPALANGDFLQAMCDAYGVSIVAHNTNSAAATTLFNQYVVVGDTATFAITPAGLPPFSFQWQSNSINLAGQTNSNLILPNVQFSNAGTYCVVVGDSTPATNTYCATLSVFNPPLITNQPISQIITSGINITLSVGATGTGPFHYQWRNNGANLIGATSSAFTISNAQPANAGLYSVLVANAARVVGSSNAELTVSGPPAVLQDTFAFRFSSNNSSGIVLGNNTGASSEPGEPLHVGKVGGTSVWFQWNAPSNGIATFSTFGSSFDTLLAAYIGNSVTNLSEVEANDDRDGKSFTSEISFQAYSSNSYNIVVDGLGGASGNIVLSWNVAPTNALLPKIASHPFDVTVPIGGTAFFGVTVSNAGTVTYQWYYNDCLAVTGQTNSTMTLFNVSPSDVGLYSVEVVATNGQIVGSRHAALEIGPSGAISSDKLADLIYEQPSGFSLRGHHKNTTFPSVSAGSLGTQIINTWNSKSDQEEPIYDATVTGSSRWYKLIAADSGYMTVDTIGSDYDTVLGIWTGTDYFSLRSITNDDNGAPDHIRSKVTFPAYSGTNYLIQVDGVNSSQGDVYVNWRFGVPPTATGTSPVLYLTEGSSTMLVGTDNTANPDPSYQWRRNGVAIGGATGATYSLTSVQFTNGGTYSVVISNLMGVVTNIIAITSIQSPLRIYKETANYRITGSATQATALQSGTNLSAWTPVFTNIDSTAAINYLDPALPGRSNGFYRLKVWP